MSEPKIITPHDRDDESLVRLMGELAGRLAMYDTKVLFDAYWIAHNEIVDRLKSRESALLAADPSRRREAD